MRRSNAASPEPDGPLRRGLIQRGSGQISGVVVEFLAGTFLARQNPLHASVPAHRRYAHALGVLADGPHDATLAYDSPSAR